MRALILALIICLSLSAQAQPDNKKLQVEHVVTKGETLYRISKTYGMTVSELRQLNPGIGVIKPGMKLKVRKELKVSSRKYYQTHEVVKGETLFRLSRKYNVKVADIRKANGLIDNNINVGQVLKIPADKETAYVEPVSSEIKVEEIHKEALDIRGGIIESGTFSSNKPKYISKTEDKTLYMLDTNSLKGTDKYNKSYVWINGLKINQVVAIHDKSTDKLVYAIVKGVRPKQNDDTIIGTPFVFEKLETKRRFTDVTIQYVIPEESQ